MAHKKPFTTWPLYTLGLGFLVPLLALAGYVYIKPLVHKGSTLPTPAVTQVAATPVLTQSTTTGDTQEAEALEALTQALFPDLEPVQIGNVPMRASLARSWPERIKGLSDTPFLPEDVVKFFVFDSAGLHSIWMKDMNYAIDILWVAETGEVVHIVEAASPESYPETFVPEVPAPYVLEVVAGFVAKHEIVLGDRVVLPASLQL